MTFRSVTVGLLVFALSIAGAGAQNDSGKLPLPIRNPKQQLELCTTDEKTDAAELATLATYSSPALESALLSSKSFWRFITDPSTPYMDRMAAASRGGSILSPEELPMLWQAMAEVGFVPSGVSPTPCSANASIFLPGSSGKLDSRVILGSNVELPAKSFTYPITAEERNHAPWLWQMERALAVLFTKTNMYYGDVRYPERVKAAWAWQIPAPLHQAGDADPAFDRVRWSKLYIRSRALTEGASQDILLFQTILKLALSDERYYAPLNALWSQGPDHHLEGLAQTAQIIILQKTHSMNDAELAAYEAASSARSKDDPANEPHAKLVKSATAILAIGKWAMDKSLNPWDRYFAFVQPICRIVDDPPFPPDELRNPSAPQLAEKMTNFEAWFAKRKPALEQQAETERPLFQSLAKELQSEIN